MATRKADPAPSEWDTLIEQVDYNAAADPKSRPTVDVPEVVLELVNKSRGKRFTLPVKNSADYSSKSDVLFSAGVLVDPQVTILIKPGIITNGVFVSVEDVNDATHLRATVAAKRGGRKPKAAASDDTAE